MPQAKKAFVLMPFRQPYDSYYAAIFRPALEAAGYTVSRADDLFTSRPIMLDIQNAIRDADVLLCEMSERNPNVFYELGRGHAIGKPAILVSRTTDDIPFDLRHIRVIVYDSQLAGWEARLLDGIAAAARSIAESVETWPPPLASQAPPESPVRSRHLVPPMSDWVPAQTATDLLIIGINLNLVLRFSDFFAAKLRAGGRLRLVIADPRDPHLVEIIGRGVVERPYVQPDFSSSLATVANLRQDLPGEKRTLLDLRVIDYVPSLSFQVLDGRASHGCILIELAPNRISVPERPHFILRADNRAHQD